MPKLAALTAGAAGALGARALFVRAVRFKLQRDLDAINGGDYAPLLRNYADDAELVFAEGDHRWSGTHSGKAAIERFLQDFTAAKIQGRFVDVTVSGPPWNMRMWVRFDDEAADESGAQVYRNRTVLYIQSRFGKIVRHEDFYEDTDRIAAFDRNLSERGVRPAAAPAAREPAAVA